MAKQNKNAIINKQTKICPLCQKPHHAKTQLCVSCHRSKLNLCRQIGWNVSIAILLEVKQKYKPEELFNYFLQNYKTLRWSKHGTCLANKRQVREKLLADFEQPFIKDYSIVPDYVKHYFNANPTKQFISIEGDKYNPLIIYKCVYCKREIATRWSDIKKCHSCECLKSSGEAIVEDFLKRYIEIKTQRETLRCINPLTGFTMPYDIEIPSQKVLIEIQGEQHLRFIPYFHITEEGFLYQNYKDQIKKNYAEQLGYKIIYIFYKDILSGKYKDILREYITNGNTV